MPEPPEHVRKMGKKASRAYRSAFESCLKKHGSDKGPNHNCYAIATQAAKQAGGRVRVRVKGS